MKLTAKQNRLILALLTEPSQKQACLKAGVAEPSLYRWLRDPAFRRALDQARARFQKATIEELARRSAAGVLQGV